VIFTPFSRKLDENRVLHDRATKFRFLSAKKDRSGCDVPKQHQTTNSDRKNAQIRIYAIKYSYSYFFQFFF
jgi:hypothetical protein